MAEAVCRMLSVHLSPVGVAYIVNPAAKSRAGVEEFQRWVVTVYRVSNLSVAFLS